LSIENDGSALVQITGDDLERLGLARGDSVWVVARNTRNFSAI